MNNYLIDTNIMTSILKKDEKVILKIKTLLLHGKDVLINGISYYESQKRSIGY